MTDLAPQQDSLPSIDNVLATLNAAPDLAAQPDLATAAANAPSPDQAAQQGQVLAGGAQAAAAQGAVEHAQHHGWLNAVGSFLGHVRTGVWDHVPLHTVADAAAADLARPVAQVATWANMPLQDITHQYRYVRDIWANHGTAAGLEAMLGGAGGVTGAMGVGGQRAADAWRRTGDPGYTLNGMAVSPGRDVAGLLIPSHKGPAFTALSGFVDAAFDIEGDPLLAAGKVAGTARAGMTVLHDARDWPGMADAALHNPVSPLGRAIKDIAGTDSATTIANRYPTLRTLAPADRQALADADTPEKVVHAFNDIITTEGFQGQKGLPVYAFTRIPLRALGDAIKNWQLDRGAVDELVPGAAPGVAREGASAPDVVKDRVARVVNAFGNHTQFTQEADTGRIVGDKFDPLDPRAADQLYTMVRYGNSERVARGVSDAFTQAQADGDLSMVHRLWNNGKIAAIIGRGLPADQQTLGRLGVDMDAARQAAGNHDDALYGLDANQSDVSKVWVDGPGGAKVQASVPLFTSQMGDLHTLDLSALNRATRDNGWGLRVSGARQVGRMYGALDDGLYSYVMSPIYRAMLLTGGFALRNSLSGEMLPRIMGDNGVNLIRQSAAKALVKLQAGRGLDPTESGGLLSRAADAVTQAMGWSMNKAHADKLVGNQQFRDDVADFIVRHNGEVLPPGAGAGHTASHYAGDMGPTITQALRSALSARGARLNPDKFVKYTQSDNIQTLAHAISGHATTIARDEGARLQAKAMLDALPADTTEFTDEQLRAAEVASHQAGLAWLRSDSAEAKRAVGGIRRATAASTVDATDPLADWSVQRTRAIQGATFQTGGQPNLDLLRGIAGFDDPEARRMLHPDSIQGMGLDRLPGGVPGMEMVPDLSNLTTRIAQFGFSNVLSPVINRLSREPIFLSHYHDELQLARTIPGLTEDEAVHMAEVRAVNRMIPEIHNPINRSQFQIAARNFIPFLFAREQSYARLAAALRENPLGWRKVQLAVHGMKDTGFIQNDPSTGKDFFTYPLSGEVGRYVPAVLSKMGVDTTVGVPTSVRGTLQGLWPGGEDPNAPARIGVSPLVNVAMDALKGAFPELTPLADAVTGPIAKNQPLWEQILPNPGLRDAIQLYQGDHGRAFSNAMLDTIQAAMERGDTPPSTANPGDPAWNNWLERVRNHTRIMFTLRLLYGVGAPSSPILSIGDQGLRDEFNAAIQKDGLSKGTQEFLAKHPNATAYTVFKTASAGGTSIPDTQRAWDWVKQNMGFVQRNGAAASFFVPQPEHGEASSLQVYQDQLAAGLRGGKTPSGFLNEIQVQRGWNLYQAARDSETAALAANSDPQYQAQVKRSFQSYVQNVLGANSPLWYQDYLGSSARKASKDQLIREVGQILDSGQHPDSPMVPLLTSMIGSYRSYQSALAGVSDPTSSTYGMTSATQLKASWAGYVAQVAADHPQLASSINRLFKGA